MAPPPEIPPGPQEVFITHDHQSRRTIFYIPKRLKKKRRSLVICLHGGGGTPEQFIRHTRRSFNKLADRNNFIVTYPEALNKFWNDGREDSVSLSHYDKVDDIGFLSKVMDYAIDSFRVDPDRIFVTGMSNGGLMSFRLACELSTKVKAIAPVAASMALDQLVQCSADTAVSVMMINGTRDPVVPYEGGQITVFGQERGSVLPVEEAIDFWIRENGCKGKMSKRDIHNVDMLDETRSEKFIYTNCRNNAKVVLIKIYNGGHTWPGARQSLPQKIVGKTAKDFNASNEIWKFFKSL